MRPVLLEMVGFGAFRQKASVDFDDVGYFALVGPTGAGKSTVIDALCFALYGKVPRFGDEKVATAVMSLQATECAVRLTFELGGERYVVVRVLRRRNEKVTVVEARLERLGSHAEILASKVAELDRAVEALVGLPFADFTRCVVLPQGEFARFLHDEPKERRRLLVRLLELGQYEAMAKRAGQLKQAAVIRLGVAQQRLANVQLATPHEMASITSRLDSLAQLADELNLAQPQLVEVEANVRAAQQALAERRVEQTALAAIGAPETLQAHAASEAEARAAVTDTQAAAVHAEIHVTNTEQAAAMAGSYDDLTQLVKLHDRVANGTVKCEEFRLAAGRAASVRLAASEALSSASTKVAAARDALEREQRREASLELAQHLHAGDECPVCQQLVRTVPTRSAGAGVSKTRSALAVAEANEAKVRAADTTAQHDNTKAHTQLTDAEALLHGLVQSLEGQPGHVAAAELLETAAAARLAVTEAIGSSRSATAAVRTAQSKLDTVVGAGEQFSRGFHAQRDAVSKLGPPVPNASIAVAWDELAEWASTQLPSADAAVNSASETVANRRADGTALLGRLVRLAVVHEVHGADLAALLTATTRAHTEATAFVDRQAKDSALSLELADETHIARESERVAAALALHLRSDRFQDWLVSEALVSLAELASVRLLELSAGSYSLTYDGKEFEVIDHRLGDERRAARSLSGGETFQASLALALALADHVAAQASSRAGVLDAIFLDEGFGTLDAESLDAVASAIEAIESTGRMVGLITHVPELAARVPVRFDVRKGTDGSSITKVVS